MHFKWGPIALAAAVVFSVPAHAQSAADLQKAADQATQAAAQAMKVAADAQLAAEQAQRTLA